jgi:hypothetical protein
VERGGGEGRKMGRGCKEGRVGEERRREVSLKVEESKEAEKNAPVAQH